MSSLILQRAVVIIGASGHARVCLDIIMAQGVNVLGFFDDDDNLRGSTLHDHNILGDTKSAVAYIKNEDVDVFIAIGNNYTRKKIASIIKSELKYPLINAVHPSTIISSHSSMGHGNFIAPGVIINTGTKLGSYVILNTGATIDHDNHIHDFAQMSPGCNLSGNVTVEEGAFLGTGAVVIPGKTIGSYAIVGAGAVVIDDIPPFSTAVGVPARVIKQNIQTDTFLSG